MKYLISLFLVSLLFTFETSAKVYDLVVAKDGTGNYTTLGTALERMGATRRVIFIKNGVYYEKSEIIGTYKNVSLIGESRDGVIIKFDDYSGKPPLNPSTAETFTFKIEGDGFYAENITFQNTASQAQAVAIYTKADTIAFKNCAFLGYQDTHYADNGRQYFLDCTIKGDVDFIFGNAAAIFDHCTIISSNRKGGYVTAPSEALYNSGSVLHGFLFRECEIVPEDGLADNSCYLGRPWGDYASTVYLNCRIGSHIKSSGWSVWTTDPSNDDFNNHESAVFAEYNSKDASGNSLDISNRVSWSRQLNSEDTSGYSVETFFSGWTPYHKTTAPASPENISFNGTTFQWTAVENARGYAILRNDSVVDFTDLTSYQDINYSSNSSYAIKTVGKYGALSETINLPTGIPGRIVQNNNLAIYLQNDLLAVPENRSVRIYDICGKQVLISKEKKSIDISSLPDGIYIIQLHDMAGKSLVKKFFVKRYD